MIYYNHGKRKETTTESKPEAAKSTSEKALYQKKEMKKAYTRRKKAESRSGSLAS